MASRTFATRYCHCEAGRALTTAKNRDYGPRVTHALWDGASALTVVSSP